MPGYNSQRRGTARTLPKIIITVLLYYNKFSLHPASTEYTHQHNRLICRHIIDYVTIDVHTKKTI